MFLLDPEYDDQEPSKCHKRRKMQTSLEILDSCGSWETRAYGLPKEFSDKLSWMKVLASRA